ncbi:hypothetical protein KR009_010832, partial [Drosophila setifemur]
MLSFFRGIFQDTERDRELKREQFDLENTFLDQRIAAEEKEQESGGKEMLVTNHHLDSLQQGFSKLDIQNEECCAARKGVITSLSRNGGGIDDYLSFNSRAAEDIFQNLHVGCVVEFLTYKKDNEEAKVVKIQRIVEHCWEEQSKDKINKVVETLRGEQSTFFNTQMRNIMGLITNRLATSIEVETDYGEQTIELDDIELTFIPKKGDRISLECKMQLDAGYADKQGEILQVNKVFPSRLEPNEKCVVERVFQEIAELGSDIYVLKEDIPGGTDLHLGDIVRADLIECQFLKFTKRAIKLTVLEKNFGALKINMPHAAGSSEINHPVTVVGETRFITTELWQTHCITLTAKNNLNRFLRLQSVTVCNASNSQMKVIEPLQPTQIVNGGQVQIILELEPKYMGEVTEKYVLDFKSFKVARTFTLIVCETQEAADKAERRLRASDTLLAPGRTVAQRCRAYANQVWSHRTDVVPGECVATKRRFVAVRLGYFEVPEKLRLIYLTTDRRMEMLEAIGSQYPCINQPLSIVNYVQRFSMILHLEEIEYFISFRNYDRDRAHFQRDGDFLSLQIENLAERRPSLVVGDVVRAVNPWVDGGSRDMRTFEGIIHKVLFNRVLLKFNSTFQEKYNGEDFRLEFYFSRFGFRKQHYAISHIVTTMGESFLFPTKITKREHPQLDVQMVDDDMYLYDSKLPWYNQSLNTIQKRAVFNIVRGEALSMPYVIFGPPGTGKTVTLVEALLQLVTNLPGARILVGAPSNSSADLLTKRIIDSKALADGDFVRLVSQNQIEKDLIPPQLMSYCATVDIGFVGSCKDSMVVTDSGLKLRCQMNYMGRHRVTISTCSTLGNFLQVGFKPGHFTHVLIDEAGQCTEPETVIPIVLLSRDRSQTILAGDPQQLRAIVINRYASEKGFSTSFLERLLERAPYKKDMQRFPNTSGYNPVVLTKLLYNYRALPSIMCMYSKLFYDDELISMVSVEDSREAALLSKLQPLVMQNKGIPKAHGTFFFGIAGVNMQEDDSPSWYNPKEAQEVFLMTIELYRANISPDQIGILTPYVKQVKTLRTLFNHTNMLMPKIGSVEEFQGQERDIMLISTVRSSESILHADYRMCLGFVRCSKRMNVAISRARSLMIIFGSPHLLSVDDCWRQLINFCVQNNAYFGCELPTLI